MTTTPHPPKRQPLFDVDTIQNLINQGEMAVIGHLMTLPADVRTSTALALRARTRSDARRFAHAADISERLIDIYRTALPTGILTAEHLDLIWGRINRMLTTVDRKDLDDTRDRLDTAVNDHITPWLTTLTADTTATAVVSLTELRDRVDEALLNCAPELAHDTAIAAEDSATLRRKGNTFIFTVGCATTSTAIDTALEKKMRERLAGLRRAAAQLNDDGEHPSLPTPSQLKAQILTELLGNTPDTMTIRVNLYRATLDGITGLGAGYVSGVGWIDPHTADRFEAAADLVKELSTDPADYTDSDNYPFPPR